MDKYLNMHTSLRMVDRVKEHKSKNVLPVFRRSTLKVQTSQDAHLLSLFILTLFFRQIQEKQHGMVTRS